MAWLVTGGAGYIGSHVAQALMDDGHDVVVIDDLSSGKRGFVQEGAAFEQGSLLDTEFLKEVFARHDVAGVIHLAGFKYAGVSVEWPLHTYFQNVTGTGNSVGRHGSSLCAGDRFFLERRCVWEY